MKLLLFEYITGGGFNRQSLPTSLLHEGAAMLRALLADCQRLPQLTVKVLLESRCQHLADDFPVEAIVITPEQDAVQQLQQAIAWADAVWIIAPESDGILQQLCLLVEAAGKQLLNSNSNAVALTSDKWLTYQYLLELNLPTVPSVLLAETQQFTPGSWVIKPIDGVGGCNTWRINNCTEFTQCVATLDKPQNYLMQPYVAGQPASLSCLFGNGKAKILCVNQQMIAEQAQQFQWLDSKVNTLPITAEHQYWVDTLARSISGLYGYVGIDFILGAESSWILEINPRLTSSYVGIYNALSVNVVAEVMQLQTVK